MKKIFFVAALAVSLLALTGCDSIDAPSPLDTRASGTSGDLNSGDMPGDASNLSSDSGLVDRNLNGLENFDPNHINPEDIVMTVYFGFDQYAVASGEREKVKKAAEFFAANPDMKIVLVGHTDWYGTEEYNMLLSDKRCKAVSDYMTSLNTDAARVNVRAMGEAGSAMDVAKDSLEAKNDRRVEIVKVK